MPSVVLLEPEDDEDELLDEEEEDPDEEPDDEPEEDPLEVPLDVPLELLELESPLDEEDVPVLEEVVSSVAVASVVELVSFGSTVMFEALLVTGAVSFDVGMPVLLVLEIASHSPMQTAWPTHPEGDSEHASAMAPQLARGLEGLGGSTSRSRRGCEPR